MNTHNKIIISQHGVPPKVRGIFSEKKRFSWRIKVFGKILWGGYSKWENQ